MLIALLDDGIDPQQCPNLGILYDLVVEESGAIHSRRSDEPVRTDHGTICAQIIHNYAPTAEFCSLGIFHQPNLQTSSDRLLAALTWCLEKAIPLIHMSAGTTQLCDDRAIREVVSKMLQQGQIIVAAHSNRVSRYTMPACYSGVLGVVADPLLMGRQFYVHDAVPDHVQIFASSRHNLSMYPGGLAETIVANSYAAPTITARVHQMLCQPDSAGLSVLALYRQLAGTPVTITRRRPDFLTSAIVYDPDQILRDAGFLDFEVLGFFSDEADFFAEAQREQHVPVVLIPPISSGSSFFDMLFQLSQKRTGIIYTGEALAGVRNQAPCIFWDEDMYRSFIAQLRKPPVKLKVPSVLIEAHEDAAVRLICKLKSRMLSDNFGCIALSDYPRAYLYGLDYAPEDCPRDLLLDYLCYTYRPDIALCSFQDAGMESICDLRITFSDYEEPILGDETAVLPVNFCDKDVDALYCHMLDE